jgi:hypothetical protein
MDFCSGGPSIFGSRDADEQHSGDAISITLVLQTMAG